MSRSVSIRAANPEDAEAIGAIVEQAFTPYIERIGVRPVPMDADYPQLIAAGQTWVADAGADGVRGVLVLVPELDHLMLEIIAVHDDVRGLGVGAALMEFAEDRARELALPEVRLYTNELMWENLEYYPKLGYVEQGRFTVRGVFHRVMFAKKVR